MIRTIATIAVLIVMPSAAQAQEHEVLRGPVPEWANVSEPLPVPDDPRGLVFVRRNDTQFHITEEGQFQHTAFRAKLLQANALQLGNLQLAWNPAVGMPTVHQVTIHRDGEEIDVLAANEFEILRREDQLEAAMINGLLTAVLQVPDLRIGDELEWSFTLPAQDPTLAGTEFGLLVLADSPPEGRFNLRLSWEDGLEPETQLSSEFAEVARREPHAIDLSFDMPGPVNPPRDAPPRYAWKRVLEYSDFATWSAVSGRFEGLYAQATELTPDSPVKREAARIAARHESEMDRAAAALELVQQQVRYIYVGLNGGNYTPASADLTWERRYGDCKGKTALLLALLAEMGIEAEAVLVSNGGNDDGLDERLPSPLLFDHILVRAMIDGKQYWLDGTLPAVVVPSQRPTLPYRWVLPLAEGGANIERIAWQPDPLPRDITLYRIDASAGFDQSAKISQQTIKRGPDAIVEYAQFSAATHAQLENAFRNQLVGSSNWDSIDSVTWHFDKAHQASVLEIVGTGPVDWDDEGDDGMALSLPGGGFNPPGRRQRDGTQDQQAPFWQETDSSCHVTTVRIPDDTLPENWSYNTTFDTLMYGASYRRMFEKRGKEIRMLRAFRVEQEEISARLAERDNARLDDFDNSMARIYFDPKDVDLYNEQMRVPATDEIDWVSDASACLGKGSGRN